MAFSNCGLIQSCDPATVAAVHVRHRLTLCALPMQTGATTFRITLSEGRNRQIRKMCEALGYTVTALHRTQFGNVGLSGLRAGQWAPLSDRERLALRGDAATCRVRHSARVDISNAPRNAQAVCLLFAGEIWGSGETGESVSSPQQRALVTQPRQSPRSALRPWASAPV